MLFTLGALRKIQAGCLLTVSDVVVEGEFKRISDEDLRAAVDQMTELALVTVTDDQLRADRLPGQPRVGERGDRAPLAGARTSRAALGLDRRRALLRAPGASARARRAGGRRRRDAGRRSRRRRHGQRGRHMGLVGTEVELAVIPRGTGVDFIRTYGIPPSSTTPSGSPCTAGHARDRRGPRRRSAPGRASGRRRWFVNVAGVGISGAVAKRTNESSKALGGKASYLWSTLAVFARWHNAEVRRAGRRRARAGADARGGRRQRPLPRRRNEDVPRGEPRRRPLRRPPDRRRDEGRPRPHAAEDLPGHASPPPEGGAPARPTVTVESRRAAADPARRRAAGDDAGALRGRAAGAAPARSRAARNGLPGAACRGLLPRRRRRRSGFAAGLVLSSASSRCSSSDTRRSSGSRLRIASSARRPWRTASSPLRPPCCRREGRR